MTLLINTVSLWAAGECCLSSFVQYSTGFLASRWKQEAQMDSSFQSFIFKAHLSIRNISCLTLWPGVLNRSQGNSSQIPQNTTTYTTYTFIWIIWSFLNIKRLRLRRMARIQKILHANAAILQGWHHLELESAAAFVGWSRGGEVLTTHVLDQSWVSLSSESWCFNPL